MMINYDIVSCVDTNFLVLGFGPPIGYESSQANYILQSSSLLLISLTSYVI